MSKDQENGWVRVASVEDVEEDDVMPVEANGQPLALYCVDGEYYATHDLCTHEEAKLSDGFLDGTVIECPLHQGTFCIKTGKALHPPVETPVATYEVRTDGDGIFVKARRRSPG